ncbi:unnamed protein product, partial [Owenia fusiformis]
SSKVNISLDALSPVNKYQKQQSPSMNQLQQQQSMAGYYGVQFQSTVQSNNKTGAAQGTPNMYPHNMMPGQGQMGGVPQGQGQMGGITQGMAQMNMGQQQPGMMPQGMGMQQPNMGMMGMQQQPMGMQQNTMSQQATLQQTQRTNAAFSSFGNFGK